MGFDLPGSDRTIFEDLGQANGPIRVTGYILGDDVAARGLALEAAFNAPGPGTLVHPLFGARACILDESGAELTVTDDFLRGLRFEATFRRWSPAAGAAVSTLAAIATAAGALTAVIASAAALADELIGGDIAGLLASAWTAAVDTLPSTAIGAELGSVAASLRIDGTTAATAAASVADTAGAAAWIGAAFGRLAAAGVPPASPSIGVGPAGRSSEAATDPLATTLALAAIGAALSAEAADADLEGQSLTWLAAAIGAVRAMVEPLSAVEWESRQQAEAARSRLSSAISTIATAALASAADGGDGLTLRHEAWRALAELRRRIHEDLDDRIGRLPSVLILTPPTRTNAWIIAHYVAGDDPSEVLATYEDIVSRNGLAHPAIVDVDTIEVLPP
jgi:prophage DNA circulation protein